MSTPDYIREFLRWRKTSPARRMQVVNAQARMLLEIPELDSLDAVTPNGKLLRSSAEV
jgi:hypothetical protein